MRFGGDEVSNTLAIRWKTVNVAESNTDKVEVVKTPFWFRAKKEFDLGTLVVPAPDDHSEAVVTTALILSVFFLFFI